MQIRVQGIIFDISAPYREGHKLSAAEAGALNQMRAENVANNVRPTVKKVTQELWGQDSLPVDRTVPKELFRKLQDRVTSYDKKYHFGMSGTRSTDPIVAMANKLARDAVARRIKSEGMTVKEYRDQNGNDAYRDLIAKVAAMPQVRAEAERQVRLSQDLKIRVRLGR